MGKLRRRDLLWGLALALLIWAAVDLYFKKEVALERAKFDLRLSELKTAALVKDAELIAKRESGQASTLAGGNPFEWMQIEPHEYIGEAEVGASDVPPGSWIYDPKKRVVAYRVDRLRVSLLDDNKKQTSELTSQWLQFRVIRLRSKDNEKKVVNHLGIESLQNFRWQNQEFR